VARGNLFVRRLLTGLLDPSWTILMSIVVGLAISLAFEGVTSILIRLTAVLLLIVSNYLFVATIFTLIDTLLRKRNGMIVVSALIFLPMSFSGILLPWLMDARHPGRYQILDMFLKA